MTFYAPATKTPLRRPLEADQYTSIAFGLRCRAAGVQPSMGSVGDCYDNAMCESFFATLECELLDREPLRNQAQARMAVFEFIEGWYNPTRRHSALGYLSPNEFEARHREREETGLRPGRPPSRPSLVELQERAAGQEENQRGVAEEGPR